MFEHITVNGRAYSWQVKQEGKHYTLWIASDDDTLDIEMPLGEFPLGVNFGVTPSYVRHIIESINKEIE